MGSDHLPNFSNFCPFWGILWPVLVDSLPSLTLFLTVLITGANRINQNQSKIKLGLFELILKISDQYLLWGPSNLFFSVGLGSKWLTGGTVVLLLAPVGFCDNNAHPSSLAFLCFGLSNYVELV